MKTFKVEAKLTGVITKTIDAPTENGAIEEMQIYMSDHHKLAPYSYKIDVVAVEE